MFECLILISSKFWWQYELIYNFSLSALFYRCQALSGAMHAMLVRNSTGGALPSHLTAWTDHLAFEPMPPIARNLQQASVTGAVNSSTETNMIPIGVDQSASAPMRSVALWADALSLVATRAASAADSDTEASETAIESSSVASRQVSTESAAAETRERVEALWHARLARRLLAHIGETGAPATHSSSPSAFSEHDAPTARSASISAFSEPIHDPDAASATVTTSSAFSESGHDSGAMTANANSQAFAFLAAKARVLIDTARARCGRFAFNALHAIAEDAARAHCLDAVPLYTESPSAPPTQNTLRSVDKEVGWSLHALRRGIWPTHIEACAAVSMPSSASSSVERSTSNTVQVPRWMPPAMQTAAQNIADSHRAKWPSRKLHLCPQVRHPFDFLF